MNFTGTIRLVAVVTALFTVTAMVAVPTWAWGEQNHGLQCRAAPFTNRVEQGTPLEVQVGFRAEPARLPSGMRRLDTFLLDAFFKLSLTNLRSGQAFTVKPYDPTSGMLATDEGKNALDLKETPLAPWTTSFPFATLWDSLEPGLYECGVELSVPARKRRWWHGTDAEWEAFGFWSGTIMSMPFRLEVVPQKPTMRTFLFPRRLRVEKGDASKPKVVFRRKDAIRVKLPVRKGFFIGTRFYRSGGLLMQSGPPKPDDVNYIDWWYDYKGGDRNETYQIEVFETADAPEHMWHPGPGHGSYKVLWTNSFEVKITERQIEKLK